MRRLKREPEVGGRAHVAWVGSSRDEIAAVLDEVADAGVQNVLALRGDPPRGQASFTPHPDGFRFASELVAFVRSRPERWPFCVGAAAYPEGHVETRDLVRDLANLRAKVDAGVDFLVTQLFFDDARYFGFVDRARAAGVSVPIIPGLIPLTNEVPGERVTARLTITSTGVGHAFPTYVTPRVLVRAQLLDRSGEPVPGSLEERAIGREVPLDLSREIADTRIPAGGRFTLDYARRLDAPGLRLYVTVTVYPDHFYTGFFESLLASGAGAGAEQVREALEATRRSAFVLFERDVPLT